jgi:AAA15 family ATPase/GTPase
LLEALYFMFSQNVNETGQIRNRAFEDTFESVNELMYDLERKEIKMSCKLSNSVIQGDEDYLNLSYNVKGMLISHIPTETIDIILDKDRQIPNTSNLVKLVDDAKINGYYEKILEAIQIIDEDIEDLTTYASYPNILYVKKKGTIKYIPIKFFGDAMQKVLLYVSVIFKNADKDSSYLLIDEIENGIHYTAQKEVWQMLFKLCQHYNVQLFATTHSHEMITAFEEVCEEFEGEGAYFEMARHAKTNQIIGIKHEIATLEYELETNTAIRGE